MNYWTIVMVLNPNTLRITKKKNEFSWSWDYTDELLASTNLYIGSIGTYKILDI